MYLFLLFLIFKRYKTIDFNTQYQNNVFILKDRNLKKYVIISNKILNKLIFLIYLKISIFVLQNINVLQYKSKNRLSLHNIKNLINQIPKTYI